MVRYGEGKRYLWVVGMWVRYGKVRLRDISDVVGEYVVLYVSDVGRVARVRGKSGGVWLSVGAIE